MDPILEMYQALEEKVLSYNPNADCQRLQDAFHYGDRRLLLVGSDICGDVAYEPKQCYQYIDRPNNVVPSV